MNEINVEKLYNQIKGLGNWGTLDSFKSKMGTPEQRNNFFKKFYAELKGKGVNLGKSSDFEKRYGTTTSAVGDGGNIKKLISIDNRIKETTDPNQGIRYHETQGRKTRVKIFFNDGRYISREGNVNNKDGEIRGIWFFRGNDNYQVKYNDGGGTSLYDFKRGTATQVSDTPFTLTQTPPDTTGVKPIFQKLMKVDNRIKKTTSPDQVIKRYDDGQIHIFFSDGNFRFRKGSVNNKEYELTGRWKMLGDNDYQVNTSDDDVYTYSNGWKSNETTPSSGTAGKTWKEVTFTLEDVLAGKAVLKRGMKGKAVEDLQKLMIDMNLSKVSKTGKPDGYFGKLTELSIKQFQGEMRHGEQDGKVGQKTLKRMYYVFNYDPDKEVDDEQPQMPLDGQNVEPQTSQPQIPAGGENTTTAAPVTAPDTTTQPKKKLTLSPINEQENNEEIVSQKVKSLQLSDIYKGV